MGLSMLIGTNLFVSVLSCLDYATGPNSNNKGVRSHDEGGGPSGFKSITLNHEKKEERGSFRSRGGSGSCGDWGFRFQQRERERATQGGS